MLVFGSEPHDAAASEHVSGVSVTTCDRSAVIEIHIGLVSVSLRTETLLDIFHTHTHTHISEQFHLKSLLDF